MNKRDIFMGNSEVPFIPEYEKILVGIPTRDRPEYLSVLLSSLIFQSRQTFDVLIVETGDDSTDRYDNPPVSRFIDTLTALGHRVYVEHIKTAGRSEAVAVNFILTTAENLGYGFVYKTDDDHLLQPNLLERLSDAVESLHSKECCPVAVSALTPFMHKVGPKMAGPDDHPVLSWPDNSKVTSLVVDGDGNPVIDIGHFIRCIGDVGLRPSDLLSAANFMMRPDAKILWEDIGNSSLHIDAVWMYKLRSLLGYKFYFDMNCISWHVVAPTGGVRVKDNFYEKKDLDDQRGKSRLKYIIRHLPIKE